MNETVSLSYVGGGSDKEYHLSLEKQGGDVDPAGFTVTAQYGRRGSALATDNKTKNGPVDYPSAKKIFDKVKREKIAKGYREAGAAPATQVVPPSGGTANIKLPELLEEITDPAPFLDNPAYWMQDKSDGVSRGVVKQAGNIFGLNKFARPVPLPAEIHAELSRIRLDTFQIDAELVGTKLVCRDLLMANGDCSQMPYQARFAMLFAAIPESFQFISIVQTWTSPTEKAGALMGSRLALREGVVFKLKNAPYRAGRNGQHKKYKFIKTLSAIAGKPRDKGKESVELFLYDTGGTEVGSDIPKIRCGTVSLIGKAKVKEGDVLEIAYLYAMPGGLMQQARILRVRDDVTAEECTTEQLIFKREEEVKLNANHS